MGSFTAAELAEAADAGGDRLPRARARPAGRRRRGRQARRPHRPPGHRQDDARLPRRRGRPAGAAVHRASCPRRRRRSGRPSRRSAASSPPPRGSSSGPACSSRPSRPAAGSSSTSSTARTSTGPSASCSPCCRASRSCCRSSGPGKTKPISIVPYGVEPPEDTDVIRVPPRWRIIATMNVFDKNLLFDMSYALMRRFAFIEVTLAAPTTSSSSC